MPEPFPLALRLGGGLLILNAIFVLVEGALGLSQALPGQVSGLHTSVTPAIIDAVLGGMLVAGQDKVRAWVIVRIILGVLLFGILGIVRKDWVTTVVQLMMSSALLGLLLGRASKGRMAASVVVASLVCVAELVGVATHFVGTNPIARGVASLSSEYEHPTPAEIQGVEGRYRVRVPDGFFVRTRAAARAINPLADRWLSRPDVDSHLLIISERIRPDQVMDNDRMMNGLVDHLREQSRSMREVRRGTLPGKADVPFVEVETTLNSLPDMPLDYMIAVYMDGPQVLQLNAFYPHSAPASVRAELVAMMQRFEPLPVEGLPGNEGGAGGHPHLSPIEGGVLRGREFPYTLQAPAHWYLRNLDEARQDLAEVDQWLMVPYEGTQLFVVGERLERNMQVDLDRYAEILREQLAQSVAGFRFIEKTPFQAGDQEGFLMRYEAQIEGRPLTYLMFGTARGELVFRVTAACSTPRLARREAEMLALLRSFRVTP